jgi:hypothetical protein
MPKPAIRSFVLMTPGCKQFTVMPLPWSLSSSVFVNSMFASFDCGKAAPHYIGHRPYGCKAGEISDDGTRRRQSLLPHWQSAAG